MPTLRSRLGHIAVLGAAGLAGAGTVALASSAWATDGTATISSATTTATTTAPAPAGPVATGTVPAQTGATAPPATSAPASTARPGPSKITVHGIRGTVTARSAKVSLTVTRRGTLTVRVLVRSRNLKASPIGYATKVFTFARAGTFAVHLPPRRGLPRLYRAKPKRCLYSGKLTYASSAGRYSRSFTLKGR